MDALYAIAGQAGERDRWGAQWGGEAGVEKVRVQGPLALDSDAGRGPTSSRLCSLAAFSSYFLNYDYN